MQVFTLLQNSHLEIEWLQLGVKFALRSFACETESEWTFWRPPLLMRTILLSLPLKLRRSSAIESRVIFWNLLFTMAVSSLLLLLYLKQIIFDF